MADKDTVFPYDDEVADPYAADDTKNPHEAGGTGGEETSDDETSDETPRRAARTSKAAKKR